MAPEASSEHKTLSVPDSAISSLTSQQQAPVSREFAECTSTGEEGGGCTRLPLPPADIHRETCTMVPCSMHHRD